MMQHLFVLVSVAVKILLYLPGLHQSTLTKPLLLLWLSLLSLDSVSPHPRGLAALQRAAGAAWTGGRVRAPPLATGARPTPNRTSTALGRRA